MAEKFCEIDPDFYFSPAMLQDKWKGPKEKKRHLVTRVSVHGFHFKFCSNVGFHERSDGCVCKFCFQNCHKLLHVIDCPFLSVRGLSFVNDIEC